MTKSTYRERLLALSNQLIKIQKPIQILDSIKWPREIRTEFFDNKFRRLPAVDAAFYQKQTPNYDVSAVFEALNELRLTIARELGKTDPLGLILQDTTTQYMRVISLLRTRGTPDFLMHSQ
jgi:hypothetical protein